MSGKREHNYDLLRIIASIAVIMLHVSAEYVNALTTEAMYGSYDVFHVAFVCFYNAVARFAVPCFIMLSGAFALADERNADYKFFYAKTFKSIGIPTLVFSVLYFLYNMLQRGIAIIYRGDTINTLWEPLMDWMKGEPYYHMWYLYMMAGIYLLVPIILKVKMELAEKQFEKVAWIFLVLATASLWTGEYRLKWSIGYSFCFLGYFMMGYVLRRKSVKNTKKGIAWILAGVGIELILVAVKYGLVIRGISEKELEYSLLEPENPLVVIASLFIFWGFAQIELKKDVHKISENTFYIYLLHAGVWSVGAQVVLHVFGTKRNAGIMIPLAVIVVFILSWILAVLYRKIWSILDNKFQITESLSKKIGLL